MSERTYVFMPASSVEYDVESAALDIDEMIELLKNAQDNGATHVVGLSGNYRGAQFVRLGTSLGWDDDES